MNKKQLVLSVLTLMSVAVQARADNDPGPVTHAHYEGEGYDAPESWHPHHHSEGVHPYEGGPGYDPNESVYLLRNDFKLDAKIFEANLPKKPVEILRYLFSEFNRAESTSDLYTTMRFELDVVDDVAGREPISIEPKLESKGQLTIKVRLAKSLENNSVALLEILSKLNSTMNSDGIDFKVFEEVKGSYKTPKKYKHHPKHHGLIVVDHHAGYHTVHYKTHQFKTALTYFGLGSDYSSNIRSPMIWSELKINVANGSQLAAREMAEFDLKNFRLASAQLMKFRYTREAEMNGSILSDIQQLASLRGLDLSKETISSEAWLFYSEHEIKRLQADLDRKTKLATVELREMKKRAQDPEIKKRRDDLEKQTDKLEALVKKNDREGVARLLEAFIPWAEMSPFEGAMWSNWVKAIRKPNPNESIVLFRGVDGKDAIQVAKDANGKDIGYGFFSTLLVKNQGNYTRRLRSIQTMRTKFATGAGGQSEMTPLQETPKIGTIMVNHSSDPVGSPFMSFTTKAQTAHSWGSEGGVIIANIDKRRVLPNVNSSIKSELEMLVPLIIFPDEVIHFARPTDEGFKRGMKVALEVASAKLGREIPEDTIKNTNEIFSGAYKSYARAQKFLSSTRSCKVTFPKDVK